MSDDPIPFPKVYIDIKFFESTKWLTGEFELQELYSILTVGKCEGVSIEEVKMQSWISEEGEFRDCYVAYNPNTKTWRIGYD